MSGKAICVCDASVGCTAGVAARLRKDLARATAGGVCGVLRAGIVGGAALDCWFDAGASAAVLECLGIALEGACFCHAGALGYGARTLGVVLRLPAIDGAMCAFVTPGRCCDTADGIWKSCDTIAGTF